VRLIITGGGTGGHIYPAVSILEGLKDKHPTCQFLFIGSVGGLEEDACSKLGVPFVGFEVTGIVGKRIRHRLAGVTRFLAALRGCLKIVKNYRPCCVVGTGGYASAPACAGALFMGIPLVLLEVNIRPGAVTRILSRWAKVTAVVHGETEKHLPAKANLVQIGFVVRKEIRKLREPDFLSAARTEALEVFQLEENRKTLAVFGGSQGAGAINKALSEALESLAERDDLQIIHITGRGQFESVKETVSSKLPNNGFSLIYRVFPYIERMELVYAVSDLAMTRAGALTVAELFSAAVPAVLVPLPGAAGGHQRINALKMKKAGVACVVEQEGDSAAPAIFEALRLIENEDKIFEMRNKALEITPADGVESIIPFIEKFCEL